jgi:hypothetical protein
MISCLACIDKTGLVCLMFSRAEKIGAFVAFVAFAALVALVAVSPVAWPRTWEYIAGLGPSCFVSP